MPALRCAKYNGTFDSLSDADKQRIKHHAGIPLPEKTSNASMDPLIIARPVAILAASCLALLPIPSKAGADYSVLVKLTSNYVYRGYSKSSGDPVVQGSLDFEHSSGFFIGTWISQVDFDDGIDEDRATIEVNPYMGWSVSLSEDWRAEAMVAGYIYDGRVYGRGADYSELFGQLHFRDLVTARAGVAYDAYGSSDSIEDYELQARFPLAENVNFSGRIGYEDANTVFGYDSLYWNIGVTWFLHKYAALDLRYYDISQTDQERLDPIGPATGSVGIENHVVVSVSFGF